MKKILFIIFFPLFFLSADYLVVSSNPIGNTSDGVITVDNIIKSFDNNFEIGSSSHTKEIPLYMDSNSTDTVKLKISNLSPLSNGSDTIGVELYYKNSGGNYNQLHDGDIITLQGTRDGNTIIGYIKIVTDNIGQTQTFGNYSFSDNISVALGDSWSNSANLEISAEVSLVAIAGLTPTDSFTTGEKFVSSTVDFQDFSFEVINTMEKSLYIKSNSNKQFKITFDNTPDLLLDGTDNTHKIAMKYYYQEGTNSYNEINQGSSFVAITGKNSGANPIGNIKFETEAIKWNIIAGQYSASITVTVSAQ